MRTLIFDPFSGISGDMTLAALVDLGLPAGWLRDFVRDLKLGPVEVRVGSTDRAGVACTRVELDLPPQETHRQLADVLEIIDRSTAPTHAKETATAAFRLLAEAEATVHGTSPDKVHFHEVGALDAIIDVLGSVAGCHQLGFERFHTRPVALGRGWAKMEHGDFPLPPPAVLKLLEGVEVRDDPELEGERTTPTGAAILKALTGGSPPPPSFTPRATGFGAGSRNHEGRPNCLRLIAAEAGGPVESERLLIIQADIDDMSPEYLPPLVEGLSVAGALDVTVTPVQMKKGRPGFRLEALARPEAGEGVRAALFAHSSTLGARWWQVERSSLPRRAETIEWRGQKVRVKRSTRPDGTTWSKPEYDDVARAGEALGLSPLEVYRALLADGVA